jgi:hypothetical protein
VRGEDERGHAVRPHPAPRLLGLLLGRDERGAGGLVVDAQRVRETAAHELFGQRLAVDQGTAVGVGLAVARALPHAALSELRGHLGHHEQLALGPRTPRVHRAVRLGRVVAGQARLRSAVAPAEHAERITVVEGDRDELAVEDHLGAWFLGRCGARRQGEPHGEAADDVRDPFHRSSSRRSDPTRGASWRKGRGGAKALWSAPRAHLGPSRFGIGRARGRPYVTNDRCWPASYVSSISRRDSTKRTGMPARAPTVAAPMRINAERAPTNTRRSMRDR